MNELYRQQTLEDDLWTARATNEFLIAVYVMIANEITLSRSWPWALPDPHDLAIEAHKKIQNRLMDVRFRENAELMSSLLIDYRRNFDRVRFVRRPTDVETGADADEEPGEDAV